MTDPMSGRVEVSRKQLTTDQAAAYTAGLLRPHVVTARAHLLDRDHRLLQDLTGHLETGQTNLQDALVNRTASASFSDPDHQIGEDGTGFARHHMIQAWSLVQVTGLDVVVVEPVFCGPLTGKSDQGAVVSVTAEDKGMLALTDVPRDSWAAKARAVDVITEILQSTGETRIRFPRGIQDRIDDRVEIGPDEETWPLPVALDVAAAIGYQLYWDAEGWARLRPAPTTPSHVYRADVPDPDVVGDRPSVEEAWTDRVNRVVFRGGLGMVVTADLPPAHPDHPDGPLSRGDQPYRVTEFLENDKVTDPARGRDLAARRLKAASRGFAEVAFTAVPARHTQPGDVQRLVTEDGRYDFVVGEASIPWGPGPMSVGYQRRVTASRGSRTRVVRPPTQKLRRVIPTKKTTKKASGTGGKTRTNITTGKM